MSSSTAKLGVKITYNLNDSSQLRLARHPPIQVSVYDDADSSQENSTQFGSSSNKALVGRFAELPLSVCVSAVKSASPELLHDPIHDFAVYVNDPTEEATDSSGPGPLVGKGLLSNPPDETSTVFGKVIKDGIRGCSVAVHLVLEKTPRRAPEVPVPSLSTQDILRNPGAPPPDVNALFNFLSSATSRPAGPNPMMAPDVTQFFSALAGCYNLGVVSGHAPNLPVAPSHISETLVASSQKPQPAAPTFKEPAPCVPSHVFTPAPTPAPTPVPREVIEVKEEPDDDIVEIAPPAAVPTSVAGPSQTFAPRVTQPQAAKPLPAPNFASLVSIPPNPYLAKIKSLPFPGAMVYPFVNAKTPAQPLQPKSILTNVQPTTVPPHRAVQPVPYVSITGPLEHSDAGPHGNGWYRRADFVTTKKRAAEPEIVNFPLAKRQKKGGNKGPATSPVKPSNRRKKNVGPATSPVKATSTIKKVTLRTASLAEKENACVPVLEKGKGKEVEMENEQLQQQPKIRTLNFLSLNAAPRQFLRTQSDASALSKPALSIPPLTSSPFLSSGGLSLPRPVEPPKTPKSGKTALPVQPETPKSVKTRDVQPRMETDEESESPLFLESPERTAAKDRRAPVADPSTPTRKGRSVSPRTSINHRDMLVSESSSDVSNMISSVTPTPTPKPIDYSDFNLPPSSPPSSFASSSPSVSPRFTLDSVVDGVDELDEEEMSEILADPDADLEEDQLESSTPISDINIASTSPPSGTSSSLPHTSDAPAIDFTCLADVLGMCAAQPMQNAATDPSYDLWNALGMTSEHQSSDIGMLRGSDLFDFEAAAASDKDVEIPVPNMFEDFAGGSFVV